MDTWIERYVPAGIDYRQEIKWISSGLLLSLLYSFRFLLALRRGYQSLFIMVGSEWILNSSAVMPDFIQLLEHSLIGFPIAALCAAALTFYHYLYHYQGSKSIYLMRRLPDRTELLRRCLTLPLIAAAAALAAATLLLILYFGIYMFVTPESCLAPGQWSKIWSVI